MSTWAQVVWATFMRDMWMALSYRAAFLLSIGGSVFGILGVFFLSEAFGGRAVSMERYAGTYFGFAVIGLALSSLMALGLGGTATRIREAQMMGTLELMLLSPNRLGLLLVSSSLWSHIQAFITLVMYLAVAIALGMTVDRANWPMVIVALALSVVSFNAVGLFAASVVIVIKQGNPVTLVISMGSALLAGVLYPLSVLPAPLQALAQLLPLTHALEITRRTLLGGEGLPTLWPSLLALATVTVVSLPLGLWAFQRAVRIAQTDGSLAEY